MDKKSVPVSRGETTSNETIKWWMRKNKGLPEDDKTKISLSDIVSMTQDDKTRGKCHIEFQTAEQGLCGHSLEEAIRNVNRVHYDLGNSITDYEYADYTIPDYIKSGLKWLNEQRVLE